MQGHITPLPARNHSRPSPGPRQAGGRRARCRRPGGHPFTLIELLVATAILFLLLGMLIAGAAGVSRSWTRLRAEQEHFTEVMVLDRTLTAVFSDAVPFLWPDQDNKPVSVFRGEPDQARLAYRHRFNDPAEGSLRFVSVSVVDDQLVAAYTDRPFSDDSQFADLVTTSVLAEGVSSVEFLYADWVGEEGIRWLEQWDPDRARAEIPLAIMVTVRWLDGREETWLRRTAGSGRYERWGNWQPAPTKAP